MTDRTSSVSGVAERYASALFELALDDSAVESVEADFGVIGELVETNADLKRLVDSPVFSAEEQERAIGAIAERIGVTGLTANFLRLLARNRRLFALGGVIAAFREKAARHRGEVTAEVVSAHPLSDDQVTALRQALKERVGKVVTLKARVDPSLLGGLIVKLGSRMVDTSLRTRLMNVKTRLREVG